MHIVEQSQTKLVLQHYPWLDWLIATVMIIAGLEGGMLEEILKIFYLIFTDQFVWREGIGGTGELMIGFIIIVIAISIGIFSPIQTITFDAISETFVIKSKNLLKNRYLSYPLNSILKFELNKYGREDNKYEVIILFTNGEKEHLFIGNIYLATTVMTFLEQHQPPEPDTDDQIEIITKQPLKSKN